MPELIDDVDKAAGELLKRAMASGVSLSQGPAMSQETVMLIDEILNSDLFRRSPFQEKVVGSALYHPALRQEFFVLNQNISVLCLAIRELLAGKEDAKKNIEELLNVIEGRTHPRLDISNESKERIRTCVRERLASVEQPGDSDDDQAAYK